MEKQRKASRCIAFPGQDNLDQSSVSEQRAFDVVFVCDAQMAEPLELSKPMNHRQNRRDIGTCCERQAKLARVWFPAFIDPIRALQRHLLRRRSRIGKERFSARQQTSLADLQQWGIRECNNRNILLRAQFMLL